MKERIRIYLYNRTFKEMDMSDFSVIPEDLFAGRKDIVKVELPDGVEVIGDHAFEGCTWLEEVIFPETLKRIGKEAFAGCTNLKTAVHPPSVEVADNAFKGCRQLNGSGL